MPSLTAWSPWQTPRQQSSRRWTVPAAEPARSAAAEMPPVDKTRTGLWLVWVLMLCVNLRTFGMDVKSLKAKTEKHPSFSWVKVNNNSYQAARHSKVFSPQWWKAGERQSPCWVVCVCPWWGECWTGTEWQTEPERTRWTPGRCGDRGSSVSELGWKKMRKK